MTCAKGVSGSSFRLSFCRGPKLFLLLGGTLFGCSGSVADDESNGPVTGQMEQAVYSTSGSAPGQTLSRPEVGFFDTGAGSCTATLIHRRYALSAAHCTGYPVPQPGASIAFKTTSGATAATAQLERVWLHPIESLPTVTGYSGVDMNSDVTLVRTTADVPAAVPRMTIAANLPDPGSTVYTYGYGGFGVGADPVAGCTHGPDGNKRMISWPLGTKPYRVCPGDSGGPSIFDGKLFGVTGNSVVLGNPMRFREGIYEVMRAWEGKRWVTGTARKGNTFSTTANTADAGACEEICIGNASCKAWVRTGTTCSLQSSVGPWEPDDDSVSGIRPLVETDWTRNGSTLQSTSAVSATHCAARCGLNADCAAYTFDPKASSSSRCVLRSSTGTPTKSAGKYSGVKQPYELNYDRYAGDYLATTAASQTDCAQQCAKDWECLAYAHTGSTCFMKNVYPAPVSSSGVRSTFKRSFALPGYYLLGEVISGWNQVDVNPHLAETCRAGCEANSSCVAYSVIKPFYGARMKCTLLSSVTGEQGDANADSGYKGLSFF